MKRNSELRNVHGDIGRIFSDSHRNVLTSHFFLIQGVDNDIASRAVEKILHITCKDVVFDQMKDDVERHGTLGTDKLERIVEVALVIPDKTPLWIVAVTRRAALYGDFGDVQSDV